MFWHMARAILHKARRIRDLPLLARVWVEHRRVRALLDSCSLPEVVTRLRQPAGKPWISLSVERIRACVDTVLARSETARRNPCLFRSLVLYSLLHQGGATPELFFGVRQEGDELQGHCWLVLDGEPLQTGTFDTDEYSVTFSSAACAPDEASDTDEHQ